MVDAGAPELFVRFAAGGAQMEEDVALRDFLGFILIPDRPVGWGRRGGFGIAARGLVIRAVGLFDSPGLSVNRLFDGDVLCGCFGGVIDERSAVPRLRSCVSVKPVSDRVFFTSCLRS